MHYIAGKSLLIGTADIYGCAVGMEISGVIHHNARGLYR
jgi:hypothetical protein